MDHSPHNTDHTGPADPQRLLRVEESQAFSEHAIDELRRQIEQLHRRFEELSRRLVSLDSAMRRSAQEPPAGGPEQAE